LYGIDSRFEAARSSSAFGACALAVPETQYRATTTSHHAVTGSFNLTFGVRAIYDESPM
jgi:hypothetical protein